MSDPFSTQSDQEKEVDALAQQHDDAVESALNELSFSDLCEYLKTRTKSEISQVLLDRLEDDMKQFKEKSPEALQEAIFSAFEEKLLAKVNGISKEKTGPAKP